MSLAGLLLGLLGADSSAMAGELPAMAFERAALLSGRLGPQEVSAQYVSWDLSRYEPFRRLMENVEKKVGRRLKNRGEAHITLVTPPELKVLSSRLSREDIRSAFKTIGTKPPSAVCVGRGRMQSLETYYIVVTFPAAERAREELGRLFRRRGGVEADFRAGDYYPHVTLGFTERDLHLHDGVVKDARSCAFTF